ncbi:helix-turn-helix domain-containing protein [Streptomyces sp. NBC_01288]|uniref:helix-turn-helix domain-containing protein n=1 Tax=Streptomyces sp. NBC_01288 TaxID=2903814 RepID=UPI002E10511C|nr:helix-turn-helix domain-containing protein [Streptomyces sp. NBC_01288]
MSPEAVGPVETIGQRVKELRARRGWTAAQLGKELGKHGVRWDRFAVANLETGKRKNVTVTELMALALALDVAPTHLLIPLDDRLYKITPTYFLPTLDAREWFRGNVPLYGMHGERARTYLSERPLADLEGRKPDFAELRTTLVPDPDNPDDPDRAVPLVSYSRGEPESGDSSADPADQEESRG